MKSGKTSCTERRYMIDACIQPGASAIFRIIASAHLDIRPVDGSTFAVSASNAIIVRGAIYSDSVLANGWEPYNQPSPAAYLPLPFSAITRRRLRGFGELLMEANPGRGDVSTFTADTRGRCFRTVTSQKQVWQVLADICRRAGVSARVAENLRRPNDLLAA